MCIVVIAVAIMTMLGFIHWRGTGAIANETTTKNRSVRKKAFFPALLLSNMEEMHIKQKQNRLRRKGKCDW